MAVLLNCFILCVFQYNLVQSTGLNLPFTSMAYKMSTTNPKFLSLTFSANDSVESKITNDLDDFKPLKNSMNTQDEVLSQKTMSVSKLLSNLGLISDNDSTPKDLNLSKQKENVDPNILSAASPFQKNLPNLRTNIKEESDVTKDVKIKKNTVNYNIKVISPPTVFKNFLISLPVPQNVAGTKTLSETNKYSKHVPPMSLIPNPVRANTEEAKQKSTTAWQNVRENFSNNDEGTEYKAIKPLVQKNTISIPESNVHQMRNIVNNEEKAKINHHLNINKIPINIDTISNNLLDYNSHQNLDILPTMCDVININQEIKPPVNPLSNEENMSTFNNMIDKQIPKYCSVDNIQSETPLSYVSKQPYISDITPILPIFSSSKLPEISNPQHIYNSDYDTYNLRLGSSLDNIISFLTSKFISAISDISATNSSRALLSTPELLHSHITTDAPVKLSETSVSFPVCISSYPEVESPTYLPKPNVGIPKKDNTKKKSITKSSVPYISSVTINYMPSIGSSDEIIIFV